VVGWVRALVPDPERRWRDLRSTGLTATTVTGGTEIQLSAGSNYSKSARMGWPFRLHCTIAEHWVHLPYM